MIKIQEKMGKIMKMGWMKSLRGFLQDFLNYWLAVKIFKFSKGFSKDIY